MKKRWIVTAIALGVSGLHFVTGENYQGPLPVFVNGYLIDLFLPMALVLLMGLFQNKILRSAVFRAVAIFGFGCLVEISQYLGYPLFGSTFDPLDILAYAGGVALGLTLDLTLFPHLVPGWDGG
ncbi:MAG: hypothetical protein HY869_01755 [Chloroflexi bacterium]|nr:hypothetical protein [Chloroflexota bacterium]